MFYIITRLSVSRAQFAEEMGIWTVVPIHLSHVLNTNGKVDILKHIRKMSKFVMLGIESAISGLVFRHDDY